jgi:hypothetical protein
MPLTGVFTGECSADPGATIPPDMLRQCCNAGYARDVCARAASAQADAAAFLVKSDREGIVEVAWAVEKNHHPVAVGTLWISPADADSEEVLNRQARAFAANYIRQKGRV